MTTFEQTQRAFVAHIKDPESNAFDDGIEDRRLKIYRDLFFNNVMGFLSSGFPVLESLYAEEDWQVLGRTFFARHACRSPYFVDISKEFVEFLSNEYTPLDTDPPFLTELAHYEWLELAISIQKTEQEPAFWDGETPVTHLAMSELASLVSYQFPVHQIGPDFQPQVPGEQVFLVVYRNAAQQVNFELINSVTAHLLSTIEQNAGIGAEDLVQGMVSAMPQFPAEQVAQGVKDTIKQMLEKQILLPKAD